MEIRKGCPDPSERVVWIKPLPQFSLMTITRAASSARFRFGMPSMSINNWKDICVHVGFFFCESLVPPNQRFGRGGCDFQIEEFWTKKSWNCCVLFCLNPNVEHLYVKWIAPSGQILPNNVGFDELDPVAALGSQNCTGPGLIPILMRFLPTKHESESY